jgi:hypothetical protein
MATAIQIRETAAENLGILGEGETLPSYEADDLDQAYTEVFKELQQLNLTTWAEGSDIPDQYARSIAMMVANARTTKYQIPDNRYQRIKLETAEAWHLFRELQARAKMGQTEIENF